MEEAKPSRTSDIPAIMRAVHQTEDDPPKILMDPVAPKLVDITVADPWLSTVLAHPFARQWRAGFLVRSRYAEDCLAEAVTHGLRQYLILGAGLDTFSYRQPVWAREIDIFEIDHAATQAQKQARLTRAGIEPPQNLTFVPIDFETMSLRDALRATRFAFDRPAFCSWLGVTQYLTATAIETTLAFIRSLPPTSEIVFTFILPQESLSGIEADAVATATKKSAEVGEPWLSRFNPTDLASQLHLMGFSKAEHLAPQDVQERYLKHRTDGLVARRGEQLMRAAV